MQKLLFSKIDNCSLIIFRILFGFLVIAESWGAILTGWVRKTLIQPKFTFNFIHLDFLQPLPGNGMYYYFFIMGVFGIGIMLGYKYRAAMFGFSLMWAGVYLMQKSSYNNHYYLLFLLNFIMCFLPAHKNLSLDVKFNSVVKTDWMPSWVKWFIIFQLFIVYTYASVAKFYPDWLDTTFAAILMKSRKDYFLIGEIIQQKWAHYVIAYFGIVFDALIIPALLYKPTRKFAFILALFFHLYNSFVLHIGIFPYLALAFCLFFFEDRSIRKIFYPKSHKNPFTPDVYFKKNNFILITASIWFIIQIALPLRHWFIPGDVLYTEEGHRLSWRMMLRTKSGSNTFYIQEKGSTKKVSVKWKNYLTKKQKRAMGGKPDMIWQFAQYLKKEYQAKGKEIAVYVKNRVRVNGRKSVTIIDPKADLAAAHWNYWGHNDWVLLEYP